MWRGTPERTERKNERQPSQERLP
jgi:hypothetical protein